MLQPMAPSPHPLSQGAGIVWPTRVGKLELNLTRVVRAREHDRVKTGVQFGFSPPAF